MWQGVCGEASMALFYLLVFAHLASQLLLAATAGFLYARLRSRATACMALGLAACLIISISRNLFFSAVPDASMDSCAECGRIVFSSPPIWKYTTLAAYTAWALYIVGFVWFAADILRQKGPHNPRMETDAATPSEGEGRETE